MVQDLACAVLDDYQDVALPMADWSGLAPRVRVDRFDRHLDGEAAVATALEGYDIVVAMRERTAFPASLLERLPRLRLLVTTGMVNASIDMAAARRLGIVVSGTRGSVGSAAELAWGLLLALMRNLPAEARNLRDRGQRWQTSLGRDLKGKTLGVVGLGRLGRRVAGYGRAFDMNVLGWSKNNSPERCAALGIDFAATLDELLERSDVVCLHLALNPETRGIVGARELARMKDDAVIINAARGPLIEERALVAALESRRIGGAALDVFDTEPLPDNHPYRTLPNVIATPHIGYVTRETYAIYYGDAVESIDRWLAGDPVRVLNADQAPH